MFLLGLVGDELKGGFYWILLGLDGFIYSAITKLYKVYILLAGARLLTNDAFTTIANQIYIVVGVAMLFVLAYAIIRAIVDPDQMTKGNYSGANIVKGVIIAVIGLAITPVIFNVAYQGQDIILKQNVIGKMFFASDVNDKYDYNIQLPGGGTQSGTVNASTAMEDAGNIVAIYIWQTFFYPSETNAVDETKIMGETAEYLISPGATTLMWVGCGIGIAAGIVASIFTLGFGALAVVATATACVGAATGSATGAISELMADEISLADAITMATSNGDFSIFKCFTENIVDGEITYFFGVSTIVGLFVCYTFLSFSIDMAVRAAKLAYYQIIAPIPLILQVIPEFKSNMEKWTKDIIHTFLEVLIRLSVIYVVVYIIAHLNVLTTSSAQLWANENISMSMGFFARLLLILGLILFAKMAPDLISKTFGIEKGDMRLGIGRKLREGGAITAAATLGAAATAGVRNFNAEHHKSLNGKDGFRARGGRMLKSIGSGLAGGLSAGSRVVGGRASAIAHGKPNMDSNKEAWDLMRNSTDTATERKRNRDQYIDQHKGPNGEIQPVIAARISDLGQTISTWAAGPVDTSFQDGQAKLLSDMASLKGTLEDKIDPEDQEYKDALNAVERIKNTSIADHAYAMQLQKKSQAALSAGLSSLLTTHRADIEAMLARNAGESDADYISRVAEHMQKKDSDLTAAEKTARDAFKSSVRGSGAAYDMESAQRSVQDDGFTRDRYVAPVGSDDYKEAERDLNAQRHDADEHFKAVKKDIVARELAKAAATGQMTPIARAADEFFKGHQKEIRAYGTGLFGDSGKTIFQFLQDTYGIDESGRLDFSTVLKSIADSGKGTKFEVKVDGDPTLTKIEIEARPDGKHIFTLQGSGGSTTITGRDSKEIMDNLKAELSSHTSAQFKDAITVGALAEGPTSATKSDVEQARDKLVTSEEYVRDHRYQREQQERQGGGRR